jgi:tetratricopeptide (TPR) repeat protein
LIPVLFSLFVSFQLKADNIDSLLQLLNRAGQDTNRVKILLDLSKEAIGDNPDQSMAYAEDARKLSEKLDFQKGLAAAYKGIGRAYYTKGDYVQTLNYWNQSLSVFEQIGDKAGIANILSNLGATYFNQGDDAKALDYYLRSLRIAEELRDTFRIVTLRSNIGAVYQNKDITKGKALEFFKAALPLAEALQDDGILGTVYVNLGEIYLHYNVLDTALLYFTKSLKTNEGTPDVSYSLMSLGKVYKRKGDFANAIKYGEAAYEEAVKLDSKSDIAIALVALGETYAASGDVSHALERFHSAEKLAAEIGAEYQLKGAYEGLSAAYAKSGNYAKAFSYQEKLLAIKDTLFNLDIEKKLGTLQFSFDIEKKQNEINLLTKDQELKQKEISRQKLVRNGFIGGFAIMLLFAGVFLLQRNRISKEKKRSDELLLNILPEETAEELKATGAAKAKAFDMVTVMFTDFKNFTQASELLTPQELVNEINFCYSEFDRIIMRYGIEKIKTIGDAYMCAGGLPVVNTTHPQDVIKAGIEMQQFMKKLKAEREANGQPFFELRLGIHTGPVVAGIVGIKKFAYDIWGDTVNTASRMESSGAIGKVNISGPTYELVKDQFECTYRGKVPAKNKGEIDMYFVESLL